MAPAAWIYPVYYIISGYFVLGGIFNLIQGISLLNGKDQNVLGMFAYIFIVIAAVRILLGIGLAAKIEIVRGIVNVFCWISIAQGLLSLPATIGLAIVIGPIGWVGLVVGIFNVISAGLMIYLLGETD